MTFSVVCEVESVEEEAGWRDDGRMDGMEDSGGDGIWIVIMKWVEMGSYLRSRLSHPFSETVIVKVVNDLLVYFRVQWEALTKVSITESTI